MLVLTRREGEAIIIDGDIRVVVLSNDRRGVRIGIEAPTTRVIVREELLREVAGANQRASEAVVDETLLPLLSPIVPDQPPEVRSTVAGRTNGSSS